MSDRPFYYDRQGNPLTMEQWVTLFDTQQQREDYRRVGSTQVGQVWVSTVWLGLNHSYGSGPPLIFETMAFGPHSWAELFVDRYSTEAEALAGHEKIVAEVRRRHHGLTKRARDERRAEMKRLVRLLELPVKDRGALHNELVAGMLLTYERRRASRVSA